MAKKKKKRKWKRRVDNKMHDYGEIDYGKKTIRINKKRSKKWGRKRKKAGILDTIVHEETHLRHPKMGERRVVKRTKRKIKRMTKKQKARHYSKYSILKGRKR